MGTANAKDDSRYQDGNANDLVPDPIALSPFGELASFWHLLFPPKKPHPSDSFLISHTSVPFLRTASSAFFSLQNTKIFPILRLYQEDTDDNGNLTATPPTSKLYF